MTKDWRWIGAVLLASVLAFACGGGSGPTGADSSLQVANGHGTGRAGEVTATATATAQPTATKAATPDPTTGATPTPTPTTAGTSTPTPSPTALPDLQDCSGDGPTAANDSSIVWGFRWYGNRATTVTTTITLGDGSSCIRTDSGSAYGAACKVLGLAACTTYKASYDFVAADGSTCHAGPALGTTYPAPPATTC